MLAATRRTFTVGSGSDAQVKPGVRAARGRTGQAGGAGGISQ